MIIKKFRARKTQLRKVNFLPFFLLPATMSVAFNGMAQLPDSSRKQVNDAVHEKVAALIQQEAKQQKWVNFQAKINIFIPSEITQYAVCTETPEIKDDHNNKKDFARMRYSVNCSGQNGWSILVTVKPEIYLDILVAKDTLDRGHILSPSDIVLKKHNISGLNGSYATQPEDLLGLTTRRRVRALQPLAPVQFESPIMVERGQRVVMLAEQDGVQASTFGEAAKKGRKGEIIKVKNESSGQVVSAMVVDMGVVRTTGSKGK